MLAVVAYHFMRVITTLPCGIYGLDIASKHSCQCHVIKGTHRLSNKLTRTFYRSVCDTLEPDGIPWYTTEHHYSRSGSARGS